MDIKGTSLPKVVAVILTCGCLAYAQSDVQPVNDRPNPYRTLGNNWAKLPEGRTWGSTSAVDIDRDGRSIWVAERCGGNSCATSTLPPILKLDAAGTVVKMYLAACLAGLGTWFASSGRS